MLDFGPALGDGWGMFYFIQNILFIFKYYANYNIIML